jgi:hypothetical protein
MQLLLFLPFCGSPLGKERAQKVGALFFADQKRYFPTPARSERTRAFAGEEQAGAAV